MTKQHEELLIKYPTDENFNITKIELTPQLIDNTTHIHTPNYIHLNTNNKTNTAVQPKKQTTKTKTQLEKATSKLYDIENYHNTTTEKTINIDLDLYQMENY